MSPSCTILRKKRGRGPRPIFFWIISLSDPADVAKLLQSDPKHPERLDFLSLNFYREKRKKIPGGFFLPMAKNGTSYGASWAEECFDRKKSPTLLRVSIKLSAILFTDYDQFESLVGQRKETKFVNSITDFPSARLSLWRRCCLKKGLAVLNRKSIKGHRPS